MYNSLTDEGILILQLGVVPYLDQPPDEQTKDAKRAYLSNALQNVGFKAIHLYEESHCDFGGKKYSSGYLISHCFKLPNIYILIFLLPIKFYFS